MHRIGLLAFVFAHAVAVSVAHAQTLNIGGTFPQLDGQWVGDPVEFREGEVYVIYLWDGDSCPPCSWFLPELNRLQAKHSSNGVTFVALSALDATTTKEALSRACPGNRMSVSCGHEKRRVFVTFLGFENLPAAIILDRSTRVVWKGDAREFGDVRKLADRLLKAGPSGLRMSHIEDVSYIERVLGKVLDGAWSIAKFEEIVVILNDLQAANRFGDQELASKLQHRLEERAYGLDPSFVIARISAGSLTEEDKWREGMEWIEQHGFDSTLAIALYDQVVSKLIESGAVEAAMDRLEELSVLSPYGGLAAVHAYQLRIRATKEEANAPDYGRKVAAEYSEVPWLLATLGRVALTEGEDAELALAASLAAYDAYCGPKPHELTELIADSHFALGQFDEAFARISECWELAKTFQLTITESERLRTKRDYFKAKRR